MPHPAAYEVKHLQAPLAVSLAAAAGGGGDGQPAGEARLRLRNKQHFSDTADLALRWRVLVDGAPVAAAGSREGWRALAPARPLPPQGEAVVALGVSWAELAQQAQQAAEPQLEVQALLAGDCLWAAAGHEVLTVQLPLDGLLPARGAAGGTAPASDPQQQQEEQQQEEQAAPLTVQQDGSGITVSGGTAGISWRLHFDGATGALARWTVGSNGGSDGGEHLLAAPLAPCVFRAPTDNDKGGSGGSSYAARREEWDAGA